VIGVVDYRAGNAPSVLHALRHLGLPGRQVSTSDQIAESTHLILPGVGAARATMDSLRELNCLDALHQQVIERQTPFLGICIGLQVLFEHSDEADTPCLGWLPGRVRRYQTADLPVPQIGWNEVHFRPHPVLNALPPSGHFYFVNGYHAVPVDPSIVIGTADYGGDFCAIVARDTIIAAQFHVEKSGPLGLRLLHAFATLEREAWCSLAV
jgi:imidazole glycerol-phosphate synthase subunit HisH